jgi:hypothetical protein
MFSRSWQCFNAAMKSSQLPRQNSGCSRRAFLKGATALGGAAALGALELPAASAPAAKAPSTGAADLPAGPAPAALSFPHFPDRLHAFVWRNWPLVPLDRMARVVGARPTDIDRLGRSLGLGSKPRITADQEARSYITVIKRNWHLLPYDQLLELLDWPSEKLAYTLREDDFLFVKLGNLKPRCERLRYQPPDAAALRREQDIARIIKEHFPRGACGQDRLFSFVPALSRMPKRRPKPAASNTLKFCYSYFALYGDPLLEIEADPYPEGYLARLAGAGVTGVWLQAVLYKLAPFPWEPERSENHQERLRNLRKLVHRAGKHGIKVFLYLNEPRAMPQRFFETRPQLKGASEAGYATLCTSQPEVQRYITESVASICRAVTGLGGFFSITASENLTNCWSHGQGAQCPRCGKRPPPEVIAEVSTLFARGVREAGSSARLIAWDWGWNDSWAGEAIRGLPKGTALMSVSEWRLPIERGGIKEEVGEYSISAVGPGPRALEHWRMARERGLEVIAKIQAGNTWELSAVPYIPALENVARHAENLYRAGVRELMLGWTLGGFPSPNLEVVSETLAGGSAAQALQRVAERRFGPAVAPAIIDAWRGFSAAFSQFPFDIGVLYSGPQQLGPANLLWAEPTGYHATMVGFPYDDLDAWRGIYPPAIFADQLEKVAAGFDGSLAALRQAGALIRPELSDAQWSAFQDECRVAEAAAIHFWSAANQARFVMTRTAANTADQRSVLERILKDEISLARRLHEIQSLDARFGFEASNQYYYVPVDLAEKVLNCEYRLRALSGEAKRS